MKFDVRKKKPKLWNAAILSLAVLVLVGVLLYRDPEGNALAVSLILSVWFLSVIALMLAAFYKQLQYNPYSYNTIIYMGFALFLLSVWITQVYLSVQMLHYPESKTAMGILHLLLNSAKTYMLLSLPFILVFSVALCVSNISLIRHEGRRFVNILGIILSFLLIAGEVFLLWFDYYVSGSQREILIHDLVANLFASVYLYFECMLIGAIVADAIAAKYEPERDKDYLIILGCGIRKDGTPSPLLRGRVDRALAFAKKQKEETEKDLIFVTSGGQGPDEVISESESMKRYLLTQGVPADQILEEDRSTDTRENMRFSKELIWQRDPEAKVGYVTTNYHVFRAGLCARRVKMRAQGMGADTKWYFWPNASVREFVGLLTEHRGKQSLIFLGMLAAYTLLTLLAYR